MLRYEFSTSLFLKQIQFSKRTFSKFFFPTAEVLFSPLKMKAIFLYLRKIFQKLAYLVLFPAGLLVFGDDKDGSRNITLRTRYILIKDGGALHIGAEKCRYKSKATIALYGKSDEGESMPTFGKKFIGVEAGGTLELHGTQKASWTLLVRTLNSSGLTFGSYAFKKDFSRGLNVRVIDQDTAKILEIERFDTHESQNESRRLQKFLRDQDPGRIVAIAVGDSAVKSLLQGTIQMIQDRLGSKLIQGLGYRWACISFFFF